MRFKPLVLAASTAALLAGSMCVGGCNVLGFAASRLPAPTIPAAYDDLGGKTAGVIVWAPVEVQADFPEVTLNLGQAVQKRLEMGRDEGGRGAKDELEGLSFPYPAASYVRQFKNDPSLVREPIEMLAPDIGVERLVYVELDTFTNRGGVAAGLVRGRAEVGIQVVELDLATGEATTVFRDAGLVVTFPPSGPDEGSLTLKPEQAYRGLVLEISKVVANRFMPHAQEEA